DPGRGLPGLLPEAPRPRRLLALDRPPREVARKGFAPAPAERQRNFFSRSLKPRSARSGSRPWAIEVVTRISGESAVPVTLAWTRPPRPGSSATSAFTWPVAIA